MRLMNFRPWGGEGGINEAAGLKEYEGSWGEGGQLCKIMPAFIQDAACKGSRQKRKPPDAGNRGDCPEQDSNCNLISGRRSFLPAKCEGGKKRWGLRSREGGRMRVVQKLVPGIRNSSFWETST